MCFRFRISQHPAQTLGREGFTLGSASGCIRFIRSRSSTPPPIGWLGPMHAFLTSSSDPESPWCPQPKAEIRDRVDTDQCRIRGPASDGAMERSGVGKRSLQRKHASTPTGSSVMIRHQKKRRRDHRQNEAAYRDPSPTLLHREAAKPCPGSHPKAAFHTSFAGLSARHPAVSLAGHV